MTTATVQFLTPEIILIAAAVAIYLGGAFFEARQQFSPVAILAVLAAAVALVMQPEQIPAAGSVVDDSLAYFARWMTLGFTALFVLLASRPFSTSGVLSYGVSDSDASDSNASARSTLESGNSESGNAEYMGSLLLVFAGLMLTAVANELVLLFVALELISIPTYILLYLGRCPGASTSDVASKESAAKYFYLSILASAMLLYGFAFLYGSTGSTSLATIRTTLADEALAPAGGIWASIALVLVFAGLGFKIAAVPFHFYAPDVYQGTTHANAALLSVVPKVAGMLALLRVVVVAMPSVETYAWHIALVMSVLTMTFGNVVALWQNHLRRLLAYSSIAHAGYMLIALTVALAAGNSVGDFNGVAALLFYLGVYVLATVGTFAVLDYLGSDTQSLEGVDELAGLGRTRHFAAGLIAIFMFSLAGIPPLAGFWGKLGVFASALSVDTTVDLPGSLRPWFITLAVIGVLNAAIAAAYYLRIVAVMYFRTPLATPRAEGGAGAWTTAVACGVSIVLIGLAPGPIWSSAEAASRIAPMAPATETAEQGLPRTTPTANRERPSSY